MPSAQTQETQVRGAELDFSIAETRCLQPLRNSGSLEKFEHNDLTPVIGTEFLGIQVADWLGGDEQLIRDLAVTGTLVSDKSESVARAK